MIRERLNLTQDDLAKRSGVGTHQTISQIEAGEREVKAWELAKLAGALFVDFSELLAPVETSPAANPKLLWRERPEDGAEEREARFLERCTHFRHLEVAAGVTECPKLPEASWARLPNMSTQEAIRLAQEIAKTLDLGAKPATSLIRILEDTYRVKVWYEDLSGKGAAACVVGDFGPAMLINRADAPWRRNFSAAHELFHLVTWRALPSESVHSQAEVWKQVEKLANVFAANLLVPSEALLVEFNGRVSENRVLVSDLVQLAREFDVSTEALLWRLVNLRVFAKTETEKLLKDETFRALDRTTMQEHWWDPPMHPERFVRLGFLAYKKGQISRARLAQYLSTSLVDLGNRLAEYGLKEFQDYQVEVEAPA